MDLKRPSLAILLRLMPKIEARVLAALVIIFCPLQIFSAPSEPSFPIPNSPGNLGGEAGLPVPEPGPPVAQPGVWDFSIRGTIKNGFRLVWTPADELVDSYDVQRRDALNGGWTSIGTTTSAVTTFVDTNVRANVRYHYRLVPQRNVNGVLVKRQPIGPRNYMVGDLGSLQSRQRTGSATLFGWPSFLPKQDSSLYSKREYKITQTTSSHALDLYSTHDDFSYVQLISTSVMNPENGAITSTSSGQHYRRSYYSEFPPAFEYTGTMNNGVWTGESSGTVPMYGGNTVYTNTTMVHSWKPKNVYTGENYFQTIDNDYNEETTLSEVISEEVALPLAQAKLAAWNNNGWIYPNSNVIGTSALRFLHGPGGVSASLTEVQYRLVFHSDPKTNPLKLYVQNIDFTKDNASTEGDEARKPHYAYSTHSIGGLSHDAGLDAEVSSARDIPESGMVVNHAYLMSRVFAQVSVSDYRGTADDMEKVTLQGLVSDPLDAPETEQYYHPEPWGPSILVNSVDPSKNTSTHVSASFGGGMDSGQWKGTLSWSGAGVVVRRLDKNQIVSSPISMGKQADGRYLDSISLEVTAPPGVTSGSVSFTLDTKDSAGNSAVSDTGNVYIFSIDPPELQGGKRLAPDFYSIPMTDATGPKYRKIRIDGRPALDPPPEGASESDSASEETYIDAFSLNLRHSTTDVYVPIPGSDLALTVRRSNEAEIWNYFSGLRPHERPDRPFGSGWSSNLGSSIEFETPLGPDQDGFVGPPEATVTDDDGNRYRFFAYNNYFFPYPSAPHEAKTYLASLTVVGGKYVFKRKFGKILEFESIPGTQQTANDRTTSQGSGVSHSYARLTKVTDRLGYSLEYHFGGLETLIPDRIEARNPSGNLIPGQRIFIRQNDATRTVTAVWDPSGNQISYDYRTTTFANPKTGGNPNSQKITVLKNVAPAAGVAVEYGYEQQNGRPFYVEPDPVPNRRPQDRVDTYQVNLASITQNALPAVSRIGFEYETDASRHIFIKEPRFTGYAIQAGAPRRIRSVTLPQGGVVHFSSFGSIRIEDRNGVPAVVGSRGSVVVDAGNNLTTYKFDGISIVTLSKFKDLFQPQADVRKPKLIYYTRMTIDSSPHGSESYSFNINAGLALSQIEDFSGNITTYQYNDAFSAPALFTQILPQGFFRFDDPNLIKKGDLPAEQLTYSGNYRILSKSTDSNGYSTSFTIDSLGRRTKEERLGSGQSVIQRTNLTYDGVWTGFVTQSTVDVLSGDVSGSPSSITTFTPDASGRIASKSVQISPGNTLTTNFSYNWNNLVVFKTEPAGPPGTLTDNHTLFTYDARQRLVRTTFEDDTYQEATYDSRGRKIAERDENGHVTSLAYDAAARLISKIRRMPGGSDLVESFRYNEVGSLQESIDPRGQTTTRKYDSIQRLVSLSEPAKGTVQYFYGKNSGQGAQLPSSFKPTKVIDARGYTTSNIYDGRYNLLSSELTYDPGKKRNSSYGYDNVGNRTFVYDGLGNQTRTEYDALNRPWRVTNALGKYEQTTYTSTGLAWKKRDLRGVETKTLYDGAGRPIKVTSPTVAAGTAETFIEYDRAGNLSKSIDARGKETVFTYDSRNRILTEKKPAVLNAENGTLNYPITTKAYDAVGNVVDTWDPRNIRTHVVYDAANRATQTFFAYGTGNQSATAAIYDQNGNVTTATDPRGNNTVNTYDSANRLATTKNGQNITTSFSYDLAGNRTLVTDGKGQSTGFQYDGLNRLVKTTDAFGNSEALVYNAENKTARIDANKARTTYAYDLLNRLTQVSNDADPLATMILTYDNANQLLSVNQPGDERDVSYTYDLLGQLASETSNSVQHTYSYDLAGNRTGIAYGGTGRTLVMSFDDLNRVQSIQDSTRLTELKYTLNGSEASRVFKADGTTVTTLVTSSFDSRNRLDTRVGYQGSTAIYGYDPSYDANGNVVTIAETYSSGLTNRALAMTYDNANRLTNETITIGGVATLTVYEYDNADNCTEREVTVGAGTPVTTTYGFNANNQLISTTSSDLTPAVAYTYDANGNRIRRQQSSNRILYGYDGDNRLTSVRQGGSERMIEIFPILGTALGSPIQATYYLNGGALSQYSYDHRTRRVSRTEGGALTRVIFSGGTSVAEISPGNSESAPTVEYLRGPDLGGGVGGLLYTLRAGVLSSDHFNSRGDVVAKTDATGAVTYRAAYEARGKRNSETGSTLDRQKANTKDEDSTGLLNDGFRYRDLETGVYLTKDPAGFIDGPNLYAYVRQNPWTAFDPEGLAEDLGDGVMVRTDNSGHTSVLRGSDPTSNSRVMVNPAERAVGEVAINGGNARSMSKLANLEQGRSSGAQSHEVGLAMRGVADPAAADTAFGMAGASIMEPGQRGPIASRGPASTNTGKAGAPPEPTISAKTTQIDANNSTGAAFQSKTAATAQATQVGVVQELTLITAQGVKVRIDIAGRDPQTGGVKLTEAKSSATAPFTKNQAAGFPQIAESGATVAGRGKPGFPGGSVIPPTQVNVVRPPEKEKSSGN